VQQYNILTVIDHISHCSPIVFIAGAVKLYPVVVHLVSIFLKMIISSKDQIQIPPVDVLSYVFGKSICSAVIGVL